MEATVILPTFGDARFVKWSIESARRQTVKNLEIFVIGDGSGAETRDLIEREARNDPRIRFFDRPKGEGIGERYRHQAILESKGKIICYLGHDDLWFPEHVEAMRGLLKDADFGHSFHTLIDADGKIRGFCPLLPESSCRSRMAQHHWNFFGPTCVAHTREIYFDLPHGWRPAPEGVWSDLHMWRQYIAHPGCRFSSLPRTTTLSFTRFLRQEHSEQRREAELAAWFPRLSLAGEAQRLHSEAIRNAGSLPRWMLREFKAIRRMPDSLASRPFAFRVLSWIAWVFLEKLAPGKGVCCKGRLERQMLA